MMTLTKHYLGINNMKVTIVFDLIRIQLEYNWNNI